MPCKTLLMCTKNNYLPLYYLQMYNGALLLYSENEICKLIFSCFVVLIVLFGVILTNFIVYLSCTRRIKVIEIYIHALRNIEMYETNELCAAVFSNL